MGAAVDAAIAAQMMLGLTEPQSSGIGCVAFLLLYDGAQVVASQIGGALAKSNPEAYAAAAQPFITNYGNELWNRHPAAPVPRQR